MIELNPTHDPARRSWVPSANLPDTDFPIQNLPFGRFQRSGAGAQCGVAIGDQVVDLAAALDLGLFDGEAKDVAVAASGDDLLPLMTLGNGAASVLRRRLSDLLRDDGPDRRRAEQTAAQWLVARANVDMVLPTTVRQFTDICASTFHIGRSAGNDERGEPICPPVFRTIPVGYDGRARSVVVSGTPVRRPNGQWTTELEQGDLHYGPEPRLDYELEVGAWIGGAGNALGKTIPIDAAEDALFGYTLVNDWSARGIQFWESMLGPFLGKSFATTVSPWVVTTEALAPFRVPAFLRPAGDPEPPYHLQSEEDQRAGGFDIALEALLTGLGDQGTAMLASTNFRHMYWTFAQMVAHHTSNGCALGAGDLIGSGTCSGPAIGAAACLLERLAAAPIQLSGSGQRRWLQDGDTVTLRGKASRRGAVAIGFGPADGEVIASPSITRQAC